MKLISIKKLDETTSFIRMQVHYKPRWKDPVTREILIMVAPGLDNRIVIVSERFADTGENTPNEWSSAIGMMIESKYNYYEVNKILTNEHNKP